MNNKDEDKKDLKRKIKKTDKQSNMHEGIADWCDCCSCEPESRWVEVAEKMDIELSDYEE